MSHSYFPPPRPQQDPYREPATRPPEPHANPNAVVMRPELKNDPVPVAAPLARRNDLDTIIAETANVRAHMAPWLIR